MKEQIVRFEQWLNTLGMRERILVSLLIFAITYLFWDFALNTPTVKQQHAAVEAIRKTKESTQSLSAQIQALSLSANSPQIVKLTTQVKNLTDQLTALNAQINEQLKNSISKEQLRQVLRSFLSQYSPVKVSDFATPKPEEIQAEMHSTDYTQEHLKVELQGSYFDVLSFLQRIEYSNKKIYWDSIDYQVKQYPMATISVTIHIIRKAHDNKLS